MDEDLFEFLEDDLRLTAKNPTRLLSFDVIVTIHFDLNVPELRTDEDVKQRAATQVRNRVEEHYHNVTSEAL